MILQRSLWQVDARADGPIWHVLCPGPSLPRALELLPAGQAATTILVGRAMLSPAPARTVAVWGPPTPSRLDQLREHEPQRLLTGSPRRWTTALERGPYDTDLELVAHRPGTDPDLHGWAIRLLDLGPSWLLAARFAVLRGAASSVRLYGLDLQGPRFASWLPPSATRRPEPDAGHASALRPGEDQWRSQWLPELRLLAKLEALAPTLDPPFHVERIFPTRDTAAPDPHG